jgi:hypothetical protein
LTLGLPLATFLAARAGWTLVTGLFPPGSVYLSGREPAGWLWLLGPALSAVTTLCLARWSLVRCEEQLRRWYNLNQAATH